MRLRQIRDFLAVVESGSIRAAARKLGVSQPGITKSVRSLEAELHVQLLQRTPHGVVPTPSGRAFLARAQVAQSELRKAEEEAVQAEGEGVGSVAFGVGPTSAFQIVPEAVTHFRRQFPHARLRILEGVPRVLLPLVRDETLDLATGPRPDAKLDPALAFRPLFREDIVVVARKGHPLRNARSPAQPKGLRPRFVQRHPYWQRIPPDTVPYESRTQQVPTRLVQTSFGSQVSKAAQAVICIRALPNPNLPCISASQYRDPFRTRRRDQCVRLQEILSASQAVHTGAVDFAALKIEFKVSRV